MFGAAGWAASSSQARAIPPLGPSLPSNSPSVSRGLRLEILLVRRGQTDLLDVVVRESAAILELLAGEDQALLVGGDALLVLDLRLDIVDGVRGLDLEGDGLTREGLHEDLHCRWECNVSISSTWPCDGVGVGARPYS